MHSFGITSLICFLYFTFVFLPAANAYPEEQLKECIASAMQNPNITGVSEESVKNYCDCALDLIVDQGKERRESGYECALNSFKNLN